jgi:short-subunit dehydrogenase
MTALVTGASVGIGRDLAVVLAENKHDLVITARNQQQLESLAAELREKFGVRVEVIVMDLAKPQAAGELFEEVQRRGIAIDILINNAGFGGHGRFDGENVDEILGMLQVNIVALTHLTRLFLPGMVERKSGRIMNLASVASFTPGPMMAVYFATKAFVLSLSEAIAAELKRTGVTVTAVCPGPTKTEFGKRAGITSATSFHDLFTMQSMPVARIGYRAMMRGQRVVVTGVQNKLTTGLVKFLPRRMVTATVKKMNEQR